MLNKFDRVLTDANVNAVVEQYKKQNKKIVFTNGCFDLLHIGHITYLEEAKKLGDILIVGINSDESVKKIMNTIVAAFLLHLKLSTTRFYFQKTLR
jgi:cytidyltransferase-like protein